MPPARVKRRRRRAAEVAEAPGSALPEASDEIKRLRADVDRLKAQRLNPKFGGIVLDSVAPGTAHYPLGFEPRFVWFVGNFAQSATIATLGVGAAVVDENVDGGIYEASSSFRVSAGGQFRSSSAGDALLLHNTDAAAPGITLTVDSFDIDGFTYTLTGGAVAVLRGFALGF